MPESKNNNNCKHLNLKMVGRNEMMYKNHEVYFVVCKDCERSFDLIDNLQEYEIDMQNVGCELTTEKLERILETGEHFGCFGYEKLEKLAQRLLELRKNKVIDISK